LRRGRGRPAVSCSLADKLHETTEFLVGVELVSVRGSMAESRAIKARDFAAQLAASTRVDWVSITDNAGGNPQLAPQALGKPILYAGKEVVIHLTCKDLNRNGLESAAWQLNSEGFHNVLAMTGDYPAVGSEGRAKPVFDIDSVGLIALLQRMNSGLDGRYEPTGFCIGAVTSNCKRHEGEVVPQYLKLEQKVASGAQFIINQVSYDARKAGELRLYLDHHGMGATPLIGNVFLLSPRRARMFAARQIPGVIVTGELLAACERQAASADHGRAFFRELAAKQLAIYRGLGYRGAYLGGIHDLESIEAVLALAATFAPDDWRGFAGELRYAQPEEFFYYEDDLSAGPVAAPRRTPHRLPSSSHGGGLGYALAKWVHHLMFTPGHALHDWGARVSAAARDPSQGPPVLRAIEHASKTVLYGCKDCGDCSLPDIAFLCPESRCAKNQRNGPCGGTRDGACEVDGYGDCIWMRAYERLKADQREDALLAHAPVVQNQGLRGTSSWANSWLGKDHATRRNGGGAT